jgi:hypothetical protein
MRVHVCRGIRASQKPGAQLHANAPSPCVWQSPPAPVSQVCEPSRQGCGVGAGVGDGVGEGVGDAVGDGVGEAVGDGVGADVGDGVGAFVILVHTWRALLLPLVLSQ